MTEHKFTDEEKILLLLKFSDNVYANAKLTPEEAKTLLDIINRQKAEIERLTILVSGSKIKHVGKFVPRDYEQLTIDDMEE